MIQWSLAAPFALAALTAGASAQVTFTGVIEKSTLSSFCQEESHFLTCSGFTPESPTGLLMKSSSLDLTSHEGKVRKFTAFPRGVECLIYDVLSVDPADATLDWCGTPATGCTVRFRVGPTGVIGQYGLFLGLGAAFLPIDSITGTLLIAPPLSLVASGNTFGTDAFVDIELPSSPSVVGVQTWWQGVRRDVGPIGPFQLSNVGCFTVLPAPVACKQPDC